MLMLTAGLQPRQRIFYQISRRKLQAALDIVSQNRPGISPQEIVRVLLVVDRGAGHQGFIEQATARELAEWAINRADPWGDDDDAAFEMIGAGII